MSKKSDGLLLVDSVAYPQNLVNSIFNYRDEPDDNEPVPNVLNRCGVWADMACAFKAARLTTREEKVLLVRYYEHKTLKEAADVFEVGPERIRQIEAKALRKIRYSNASGIIKEGMATYIRHWQDATERQYEANAMEKAEERFAGLVRQWEAQHPGETLPDEPLEPAPIVEKTPIEDMDLSARSYNCLKRCGCNTAQDIVNLVREKGYSNGLMKVRNLGRQSLKEIIQNMREKYGIDLDEVDREWGLRQK